LFALVPGRIEVRLDTVIKSVEFSRAPGEPSAASGGRIAEEKRIEPEEAVATLKELTVQLRRRSGSGPEVNPELRAELAKESPASLCQTFRRK